MKSCLGFLLVMLVLVAVFGCGGLIWFLSNTAEFTRKGASTPMHATAKTPVAIPRAVVPIRR